MRKGHQPVFTVSSRLSEPPSLKTSGQLPTAAQKFLRCRSALGTSLTHKVAKSFSWVVCGVQYSCSDIQPELRYFSPPCSVSVRRSECTAGRGSDSHKIQAGMRYETRGALRAHTASVLASLDHHLWDKIVASLSLEDSAALAATCRWSQSVSRLSLTPDKPTRAHDACLQRPCTKSSFGEVPMHCETQALRSYSKVKQGLDCKGLRRFALIKVPLSGHSGSTETCPYTKSGMPLKCPIVEDIADTIRQNCTIIDDAGMPGTALHR